MAEETQASRAEDLKAFSIYFPRGGRAQASGTILDLNEERLYDFLYRLPPRLLTLKALEDSAGNSKD